MLKEIVKARRGPRLAELRGQGGFLGRGLTKERIDTVQAPLDRASNAVTGDGGKN